MRVLVLDDDSDLRDLLCIFAQGAGAACTAVGSVADLRAAGGDALACDVAILDVNLGPGVPSGVEAYEWLRARHFSGQIVFLTGHARSHPLVQRALALPEVGVLEKPVDAAVLRDLLRGKRPEPGRERR